MEAVRAELAGELGVGCEQAQASKVAFTWAMERVCPSLLCLPEHEILSYYRALFFLSVSRADSFRCKFRFSQNPHLINFMLF